ncbi:MAG: DUF3795 domain-containing protein [Candidatus Eiseniibacteriota bacterium]|nr:MAG: DUF3795 domain-containing protein [Candidatus Eisenbacteria bacterium]
MIGVCGLTCTECPAFLATQKNDDKERARVAEMWNKEFKANLKAEDINCTGCQSTGDNVFSHTKVCEIRKCGREQAVVTCGHCGDYGCDKITEFFKMAPDAKMTLDNIRKDL